MQKSKILTGLAILAAVVALGVGIGWLASRATPSKLAQPSLASAGPESSHAGTSPHSARSNAVASAATDPAPGTGIIPPASTEMTTGLSTNWEEKLDEILSSDDDDTNKVQQLFAMFPKLPADGQEEVAQHLSNLVEDENYAPLGKLLADPKLPDEVLEVLMSDLLNRPNATKLPMFLEIAKNPDHSKAEESKDLLELYLEEDYGTNWDQWKQKMVDWLKENPD